MLLKIRTNVRGYVEISHSKQTRTKSNQGHGGHTNFFTYMARASVVTLWPATYTTSAASSFNPIVSRRTEKT